MGGGGSHTRARGQGECATRQPASRTDGRNRRTDARAGTVSTNVFGGRVRRAHSAIVRSATELLLGAHQLSGVRRRRRDNALSPPARPQTCLPVRPSPFQPRASVSGAARGGRARAPPRGRRPRSYTRRARVGVRMCVSERAV